MHLPLRKFTPGKFDTYTTYCGDLHPPVPKWSRLRPSISDSEIGIFVYMEYNGEIHPIRFVLNDTIQEKGYIDSWILYPLHADKKDFPKLQIRKLIILNAYNPDKKKL